MSEQAQLNLQSQLQYAHSCLLYHLDEKYVNSEQQIPRYYIRESKAIIFLTTQKHLLNTLSQGIALFRVSKSKWSAPCSVGLANEKSNSGSFLNSITFTETDYILLILDKKIVSSFVESGKLFLENRGKQAHIMDGPLGRNAKCSKNLGHDDKPLAGILCYAIRRNVVTNDKINSHGHFQWLQNYEIVINNEDNYQYYSRLQDHNVNKNITNEIIKFSNEDFLTDKIPKPIHDKHYCELIEFLDSYSKKPTKLKSSVGRDKTNTNENALKNKNQNLDESVHFHDTSSQKDTKKLMTNLNNATLLESTKPKEVNDYGSHVVVTPKSPITIKEDYLPNPQQLEHPKEDKNLQGVATKEGIFYTSPSVPTQIVNSITNTVQKLAPNNSSSDIKGVKNNPEIKEPYKVDEAIRSASIDALEPAPDMGNRYAHPSEIQNKDEVKPPMQESRSLQPTIDQ